MLKPTERVAAQMILRRELRHYIAPAQALTIAHALGGEESEFFAKKITELDALVKAMPTTGQTDGQGLNAVAHLHYFTGNADWYITERDRGDPGDEDPGAQHQAYGWADLGQGGGELGYISLVELLKVRTRLGCIELDLHFTPTPLHAIDRVRPRV